MTYTMTRARWPGILQAALVCKIRTNGIDSAHPSTWDMTVSIGAATLIVNPVWKSDPVIQMIKFKWGFFTMTLESPVDINNPWGP